MRKYYIDNIRILCILMLFPYHTAMIFNGFGEPWYVHSKDLFGASMLIIGVYPWWMSVVLTIMMYEILKKIVITRFLFGIKKG